MRANNVRTSLEIGRNSYKEKKSHVVDQAIEIFRASLLLVFQFNGKEDRGLDPHLDIFLLKRERKKCHRGFCRRRRRLVRVTIALWSERFLHGISNLPMRIEEKHPHLELAALGRRLDINLIKAPTPQPLTEHASPSPRECVREKPPFIQGA